MNDLVFSGHQPNLLPYMGFFYKMFKSDIFVLDDDVQYSSLGLHNANYIKVAGQKHKFTIPVKYNFGDKINEVKISYDRNWDYSLMKTLEMNYGKAPHFADGYDFMVKYISIGKEYLVDMNIEMIMELAKKFNIDTKIIIASEDVPTELRKNERNIYQCKTVGCNVYYSGEGGRDYNDEEAYSANGIRIEYTDYEPVVYHQTGRGFIENLSVLDYIMNVGFELPKGWEK